MKIIENSYGSIGLDVFIMKKIAKEFLCLKNINSHAQYKLKTMSSPLKLKFTHAQAK